jgi:hypothetical protein
VNRPCGKPRSCLIDYSDAKRRQNKSRDLPSSRDCSLLGGERKVTEGRPMDLAVGSSIVEQDNGTQKVQTLFRSSIEWYEVDKYHAAPLHARQIFISGVISMQKSRALALVESGAPSTKKYDLSLFSIRWTRCSKVSNPAVFQESRYGDVFGFLETCVP